MAELGKVIAIEGNEVTVSIKAHAACAGCKVCVRNKDGTMQSKALNLCNADLGDYVEVELKDGTLTHVVGIAYGIPFGAMLIGFVVGYQLLGEVFAFILGISFVTISFLGLRAWDKKRKTNNFLPVAINKVDADTYDNFDGLNCNIENEN